MRVPLTTLLLFAAPLGARADTTAAEGAAASAQAPEPAAGVTAPPPPATVAPAPAPELPSQAAPPPVVPTQALVEKVGHADRLFLAGDYRNALFAYQDAVYLQPKYAPARVRLGRAYLALRYPAQAIAQAEAALAIDPDSADARRLIEEARTPPARPAPPVQAPGPGSLAVASASTPATIPDPPPPAGTRRIYRLTPEPESRSAPPPARVESEPAVNPVPAGARAEAAAHEPGPGPRTTLPTASPAAPATPSASAAQHYRAALVLMQSREWARATAELSAALLADPRLAVAYAARGSAHFGLGKYREAADDYRGALVIDPGMATPVYGLAECYRVLGDGRSALEMYERYARSSAPDVRDDLRAMAAKRARELR